MNDDALKNYLSQLEDLKSVAGESAQRIVQDDLLFRNHANLFAKSYLITLCTILESYLKAEITDFIAELNDLLSKLQLCKNPIIWGLIPKNDDWYGKLRSKQIDERLSLLIDEEAINDKLSANVDRTIATFQRCGMNLKECKSFQCGVDVIGAVVSKRNSIVHNNDDASDFTCTDVIMWIEEVKSYIQGICAFVSGIREHNARHIRMLNADKLDEVP